MRRQRSFGVLSTYKVNTKVAHFFHSSSWSSSCTSDIPVTCLFPRSGESLSEVGRLMERPDVSPGRMSGACPCAEVRRDSKPSLSTDEGAYLGYSGTYASSPSCVSRFLIALATNINVFNMEKFSQISMFQSNIVKLGTNAVINGLKFHLKSQWVLGSRHI